MSTNNIVRKVTIVPVSPPNTITMRMGIEKKDLPLTNDITSNNIPVDMFMMQSLLNRGLIPSFIFNLTRSFDILEKLDTFISNLDRKVSVENVYVDETNFAVLPVSNTLNSKQFDLDSKLFDDVDCMNFTSRLSSDNNLNDLNYIKFFQRIRDESNDKKIDITLTDIVTGTTSRTISFSTEWNSIFYQYAGNIDNINSHLRTIQELYRSMEGKRASYKTVIRDRIKKLEIYMKESGLTSIIQRFNQSVSDNSFSETKDDINFAVKVQSALAGILDAKKDYEVYTMESAISFKKVNFSFETQLRQDGETYSNAYTNINNMFYNNINNYGFISYVDGTTYTKNEHSLISSALQRDILDISNILDWGYCSIRNVDLETGIIQWDGYRYLYPNKQRYFSAILPDSLLLNSAFDSNANDWSGNGSNTVTYNSSSKTATLKMFYNSDPSILRAYITGAYETSTGSPSGNFIKANINSSMTDAITENETFYIRFTYRVTDTNFSTLPVLGSTFLKIICIIANDDYTLDVHVPIGDLQLLSGSGSTINKLSGIYENEITIPSNSYSNYSPITEGETLYGAATSFTFKGVYFFLYELTASTYTEYISVEIDDVIFARMDDEAT